MAAAGALVALVFAWRTVTVARKTLSATKDANAEAHRAHLDEMAERKNALTEERGFERLRQLERVVETVTAIGRSVELIRRGETMAPIQVRFEQHQLRAALAALTALGGPDLPKCGHVVDMPTDTMGYVDDALEELARILREVGEAG